MQIKITVGISLIVQWVRIHLPMPGTWVQSLGWEDPLEKGMLPTPVFWTGEFQGLYTPWGCEELEMTE